MLIRANKSLDILEIGLEDIEKYRPIVEHELDDLGLLDKVNIDNISTEEQVSLLSKVLKGIFGQTKNEMEDTIKEYTSGYYSKRIDYGKVKKDLDSVMAKLKKYPANAVIKAETIIDDLIPDCNTRDEKYRTKSENAHGTELLIPGLAVMYPKNNSSSLIDYININASFNLDINKILGMFKDNKTSTEILGSIKKLSNLDKKISNKEDVFEYQNYEDDSVLILTDGVFVWSLKINKTKDTETIVVKRLNLPEFHHDCDFTQDAATATNNDYEDGKVNVSDYTITQLTQVLAAADKLLSAAKKDIVGFHSAKNKLVESLSYVKDDKNSIKELDRFIDKFYLQGYVAHKIRTTVQVIRFVDFYLKYAK